MNRLDLAKRLDTVEKIRQPSEHLLVLLRRLIRYARKQPERRDIDKPAVLAEGSDVNRKLSARHDILRRKNRVQTQPQRLGDIVDRSARNITERPGGPPAAAA